MQDFNMKVINGTMTVEIRTDGGIGLYYDTEDGHNTIMLERDMLINLMGWLITYIESQKNE